MAALYDLFRTPQPKGESKVRYHARSVVTGKMDTNDLVHAIAQRSAFKEGVVTGVLVALEEALREALAEGKGEWMIFRHYDMKETAESDSIPITYVEVEW